ncbi:MAG: tRNA preQ1(34) S-adenosylmethionine ribosyltransferase-isomerase QueA [Spirochaetes bacterium]|jgi:S-adenosylmethionine:tRNA ribosyltransferase-isomerase|nr:tRNA preQ1(34) S-adenosylmethionine ribosyltransferase-isomerase QueA [Spirochaetota bacterium]
MTIERPYRLSDFEFNLPDELIAQEPANERDASRLLVMSRGGGLEHRMFRDILEYLREGDVLVFNDARVMPARVYFIRQSGARVEFILTGRLDELRWTAICNRTSRIKIGETLRAQGDETVTIRVLARGAEDFTIESGVVLDDGVLETIGVVPLPPYIRRDHSALDVERYQTVYARESGAVAAPTAGLHFSTELLHDIAARGVEFAYLTLFVSWGTFQPVRHEDLSLHRMHSERFILPEASAAVINRARAERRRVIAAGTTSLRVLETTFHEGANRAAEGVTDLFIYPPTTLRSVDALLTNFHTPRSTLLMLVAAFAGYASIMEAYREAVANRYRFFSYGDAMLIL